MATGAPPPKKVADMLRNLSLSGRETLKASMKPIYDVNTQALRSVVVKQCVFFVHLVRRVAAKIGEGDAAIIGVIGCGLMGRLLIDTLLALGYPPRLIVVSTRSLGTLGPYQRRGVRCISNNAKVAKVARVLFLCVGPAHVRTVASELRGSIRKKCILVSLVSSLDVPKIKQLFGVQVVLRTRVQRTMLPIDNGDLARSMAEHAAAVRDIGSAERLELKAKLPPFDDTPLRSGDGSGAVSGAGAGAGAGGDEEKAAVMRPAGPLKAHSVAGLHLCSQEEYLRQLFVVVAQFGMRSGIPRQFAESFAAQELLGVDDVGVSAGAPAGDDGVGAAAGLDDIHDGIGQAALAESKSKEAEASAKAAVAPPSPRDNCGVGAPVPPGADADYPGAWSAVAGALPLFWAVFTRTLQGFMPPATAMGSSAKSTGLR